MSRRDKLQILRPGRLWLPAHQFQGLDNNGTASISLSQGTPTMEPASGTIEIVTIPMTTADEVHTVLPVPWDWRRDGQVGGRIYFIHASTDASDQPVWNVGTLFYAKQAQTTEIQANADVTVAITSPATSATDDSLEVTAWTNLRWDEYYASGDLLAGIAVELDALGSAGADESEFLGLELMYERRQSYNLRSSCRNDILLNVD